MIDACLLGGTIGDAMGGNIDFHSLDQVRRQGIAETVCLITSWQTKRSNAIVFIPPLGRQIGAQM